MRMRVGCLAGRPEAGLFFSTALISVALWPTLRTRMNSSLSLSAPDTFPIFPYDKPYGIQLKLMQHLYSAIEDKAVAVVESPTGTVNCQRPSKSSHSDRIPPG